MAAISHAQTFAQACLYHRPEPDPSLDLQSPHDYVFLGSSSKPDDNEHTKFFEQARAIAIRANFQSKNRQIVSLGNVIHIKMPVISTLKKCKLTLQGLCSPQERWDSAICVLMATAALVIVVAVAWFIRWMVLEAQDFRGRDSVLFYSLITQACLYGIIMSVPGLGVVYLAFLSLTEKVQQVYQRLSRNFVLLSPCKKTNSQTECVRKILIGNSVLNIKQAAQQTLQKVPAARGKIPHPREDRDMTSAEQKQFVEQMTVFFSLQNPEALIACWSHTEIRVTGNQILNDRNLQLTALETIVATRNQAFLNLLPEEIRRSHFWDWKTPADLEREATARSSQ